MPAEPGTAVIRLVLPSHPQSVRAALAKLFATDQLKPFCNADRDAAEIVLAEVLNNVAEHAYAGEVGLIEVTIQVESHRVACLVVDRGHRMPLERLPVGHLPAIGPLSELPEGGFGWHLIRTLTDNLDYRRIDDRNELTFSLPRGQ